MKDKKIKIGLALSGGGAKGLAHIGVLKALDEAGIKIDYIAGISMGSIVGAAYASGSTADEMIAMAHKLKSVDLLDFITFRDGGFLSGNSATKQIKKIVKTDTFEHTNIPFCCTAVDVENGEKVVLNSGDLISAVRASMSVPVLFRPVNIENRYFVDGGLAGNLPIVELENMGADFIIAVDVLGTYTKNKRSKSMISTTLDTVFILQKNILELYLELHKPDVYINVNLGYADVDKFSKKRAEEYIKAGEEKTNEWIDTIKKEIEKMQSK